MLDAIQSYLYAICQYICNDLTHVIRTYQFQDIREGVYHPCVYSIPYWRIEDPKRTNTSSCIKSIGYSIDAIIKAEAEIRYVQG